LIKRLRNFRYAPLSSVTAIWPKIQTKQTRALGEEHGMLNMTKRELSYATYSNIQTPLKQEERPIAGDKDSISTAQDASAELFKDRFLPASKYYDGRGLPTDTQESLKYCDEC
jgi:hypothetical protein